MSGSSQDSVARLADGDPIPDGHLAITYIPPFGPRRHWTTIAPAGTVPRTGDLVSLDGQGALAVTYVVWRPREFRSPHASPLEADVTVHLTLGTAR